MVSRRTSGRPGDDPGDNIRRHQDSVFVTGHVQELGAGLVVEPPALHHVVAGLGLVERRTVQVAAVLPLPDELDLHGSSLASSYSYQTCCIREPMSGTWRGTSYGYSRKPCQSAEVSANISRRASRPPGPVLPLGTAKCPADPLPGTSEGARRLLDNYTACPTYYGAELPPGSRSRTAGGRHGQRERAVGEGASTPLGKPPGLGTPLGGTDGTNMFEPASQVVVMQRRVVTADVDP